MRRRRRTLPVRYKPLRMGLPRVTEDSELYQIVASFGDKASMRDPKVVEEMHMHVESWCKPWEDWQLAVICLRARLFLGSIRKELGRRQKLDPDQLRLLKGL